MKIIIYLKLFIIFSAFSYGNCVVHLNNNGQKYISFDTGKSYKKIIEEESIVKMQYKDKNYISYNTGKTWGLDNSTDNLSEFSVFPNPVRNQYFTIFDASNKSNYDVLIYNESGQIVLQLYNKKGSVQIPNYFNSGIYFICLITKNNINQKLKLINIR